MSDAPITKLSSLDISPDPHNKNNGFYVPQVTTAQRNAIPGNTIRNGGIIYNSNLRFFQVYQDNAWKNLNTSLNNASGAGLNGAPLLIPTGAEADVEVAGNEVQGFIYYDTTNNVLKLRDNAAWKTIAFTA